MLTEALNHASSLATFATSRRAQLAGVAEAWLAMGAATFSMWSEERLLAQWPRTAPEAQADLVAQIKVAGRKVGKLSVVGLTGPTFQARLQADADLIAHLTLLEDELEHMTAALIEEQDQLLAIYDLTRSFRSHLDIDQTLRSIVRESARLVKAQSAFFALPMEDGQSKLGQYPADLLVTEELLTFFRELQRCGRDLVLNAPSATLHFPDGVHKFLFVPVTIQDSDVAGLTLVNKVAGDFNAPDLKLARAIADQASAQIENVLLYQEMLVQAKLKTEVDLAAQIQLRLLPQHIPSVDGLDIRAASRPALQVGGDFYDFIQRPQQPFVFTIGDVTGKGLPAALLMAMSRTAIRINASAPVTRLPDVIMSRVTEDLYDDFTEVSMFATAFIGQYHHAEHKLVYVNAGHSPVIYCPADSQAQLLEADGTPLGVLPISLCENQVLRFQANDLLIVATDGFSEARSPRDELFGYERLLRLAEEIRHRPAREIVSAFFDAVDRFGAGHPQDDDQTLVVVKGVAA